MTLSKIHHVARLCNDAKISVIFCRDLPGMEFKLAIADALH